MGGGRKDVAIILVEQQQIHNVAAHKAGVHMLPKHHLAHICFVLETILIDTFCIIFYSGDQKITPTLPTATISP